MFCVSAKNVTLGLYPTMRMAQDSIRMTCADVKLWEFTDVNAKLTGFHPDTAEYIKFDVVQVRIATEAGRMF